MQNYQGSSSVAYCTSSIYINNEKMKKELTIQANGWKGSISLIFHWVATKKELHIWQKWDSATSPSVESATTSKLPKQPLGWYNQILQQINSPNCSAHEVPNIRQLADLLKTMTTSIHVHSFSARECIAMEMGQMVPVRTENYFNVACY